MPRKSYWQKVLGLSSCTGIKQSFFPCLPARSRSGRQPGNRVPFPIYALIRHGGVAETSPTSKALRVPARTVRSCWVESAFVWMGLATNGVGGASASPICPLSARRWEAAPRPYRQTGYANGRPFPDGLCLVSHRGFEPRTLWLKVKRLFLKNGLFKPFF